MKQNLFLSVFILLVIIVTPLPAEIVLDGSLGSSATLKGPNFMIDAELGQQHGANLFYSFNQFNLHQHESATFSGPNTVNNIITRVTGGNPSHIDGTLRLTISQADLYFLNPAGILFGEQARLDIPGGFHASTADTLHLQDGGQFNASQPKNTLLTVAPPRAFGFLAAPENITLHPGSVLTTPLAATLSLIGGDITMTKAQVKAPDGQINLVSLARAGQINTQPKEVKSVNRQGTITLSDNTIISVSGSDAGSVTIRGRQLLVHDSTIQADTQGNLPQTGQIDIVLGHLEMTNSRISAESHGAGGAGYIIVQANTIQLTEGARITGSAFNSGKGGDININAKQSLKLEGEGQDVSYSGIFTRTMSQADNAGAGGNIILQASELTLKDGATISASTFGAGQGGNINLKVKGTIVLSGDDSRGEGSFIGAGAWSDADNAGNGGNLVIEANELQILDGAGIETGTGGPGHGGNTTILIMDHILLAGKKSGDGKPSRILTTSEGQMATAGDAGTIHFITDQLSLTDNTTIEASSKGPSRGGDLMIQAHRISVTERSSLSASSSGQGDAGNIILHVGELSLQNRALITTATTHADGGNITITSPNFLYLINSDITTSVEAETGNGGNITLHPAIILLDGSRIIAKAVGGEGGRIDISTTGIYKFSSSYESIIDASSQFGVDGAVVVNSPETDVSSQVIVLINKILYASDHFQPACNSRNAENVSRFAIIDSEGTPNIPNDLLSSGPLLPQTTNIPSLRLKADSELNQMGEENNVTLRQLF